uniref:Uncharacterized protein n=1 Tax=Vespula pensylvanica TaxID=30213 RepID=A0A834KKW0_VESPE|nr:hypothetical protein H0235_014320 [Vespula pensylvanica]
MIAFSLSESDTDTSCEGTTRVEPSGRDTRFECTECDVELCADTYFKDYHRAKGEQPLLRGLNLSLVYANGISTKFPTNFLAY